MLDRVRSLRYWILQLGLAACWIGAWHFGRVLEHTAYSSLWFPPAGLSFALFLVEGSLALPAVMTGAVVATFHSAALHGDGRAAAVILVTGLGFGVAHSFAYGLGAWLFARLDRDDRFGTSRSVVGFLFAATVSSLLATVLGVEELILTGASVPGGLSANLVPWWIGDLVAVVTLAPVFVLLADRALRAAGQPCGGWSASLRRLGSADAPLRGFVLKLAISLGLVAAFGTLAAISELGVPVALVVYVIIVPLMWIAHTDGGLRTVVAVAVLAMAVIIMTRLLGLTEQSFNYQAAMIAIAATGLFNLAVPRLYADNRRLLNRVTFDQLTGARTRPAFLEAADEAIAGRRRRRTPIALIVFDIDHFKSINDTHGHAAGDAVLEGIGRLCRSELRGIDVFGRLGDEEFAVLVPDTERGAAAVIAERLRDALGTLEWHDAAPGRRVTASFGVIAVAATDSLAAALERADRALYRAKNEGRDRVAVG